MNNPIDKNTIMAYLYGELDEASRLKVEAYLLQNPKLAEEISDMQAVRNVLSEVPQPEIPVMAFEAEERKDIPAKRIPIFNWSRVAAAAIAILLISLIAFNTRVEFRDQSLVVQFGESAENNEYSQDKLVEGNQLDQLQDQLTQLQLQIKKLSPPNQLVDYDQRIQQLEKQNHLTKKVVQQIFDQKFKNQMPQFVSSIQDVQENQTAEYREILNLVWEELQEQRQLDLEAISGEFVQLKRTVHELQLVTDQAFETILSTTNME